MIVREDGGLGVLRLRTEEMLLLTECPRTVDSELSVPDEMVERGRGINSTLSENPTRSRDGGRVDTLSKGGPNGSDRAPAGTDERSGCGGTE